MKLIPSLWEYIFFFGVYHAFASYKPLPKLFVYCAYYWRIRLAAIFKYTMLFYPESDKNILIWSQVICGFLSVLIFCCKGVHKPLGDFVISLLRLSKWYNKTINQSRKFDWLWARNSATIPQVFILKFDVGLEKFPGK